MVLIDYNMDFFTCANIFGHNCRCPRKKTLLNMYLYLSHKLRSYIYRFTSSENSSRIIPVEIKCGFLNHDDYFKHDFPCENGLPYHRTS